MREKVAAFTSVLGNESTAAYSPSTCACQQAGVGRRRFVQLLGGIGAATFLDQRLAMAGPLEASDFAQLIPPNKALSSDWFRSISARGEPTVYRGRDTEVIGMPVGGLCAGLLYLGGDGKLWLWDIMNQVHEGVLANGRDGLLYAHPLEPVSPVETIAVIPCAAACSHRVM